MRYKTIIFEIEITTSNNGEPNNMSLSYSTQVDGIDDDSYIMSLLIGDDLIYPSIDKDKSSLSDFKTQLFPIKLNNIDLHITHATGEELEKNEYFFNISALIPENCNYFNYDLVHSTKDSNFSTDILLSKVDNQSVLRNVIPMVTLIDKRR